MDFDTMELRRRVENYQESDSLRGNEDSGSDFLFGNEDSQAASSSGDQCEVLHCKMRFCLLLILVLVYGISVVALFCCCCCFVISGYVFFTEVFPFCTYFDLLYSSCGSSGNNLSTCMR